jgi:DNA-binding NarL/FixJ family response regulator
VTRRGAYGGASVAEVAEALGVSERTVRRDTAHALELLEVRVVAALDLLDADRDALLGCVRRLAWLCYLERLAACPAGCEPDDEPPPAA